MKKASFFLVVIFISISLCSYGSPQKNKKRFTFVPTVDIYKINISKKVFFNIDFPAKLKSVDECIVKAKVSGTLIKKLFKEGDFVRKGQIIMEIDPSLYEADVEALKAQLKLANAKLENAKISYERIEKSFKENLVSAQKRDDAFFEFKQAEANYEIIKAKLKKAEIYLRYTKVKAPISGFTSERLTSVGNYINAGDSLVKITKLNPIYADFSIPDNEFLKYKDEIKTDMKVRLIKHPSILGHLDFVGKTVDSNTATVKLRAIFDNKHYKLMPNEFVRVKLIGVYVKNVAKVPQKSVIQMNDFAIVYLIRNNKAIPHKVKIIKSYGQFFLVRGLKDGDTIAYDNLMRLRPNEKVRIGKVIGK